MNSERPKLQHRTQEEQQTTNLQASAGAKPVEFATVEEMLRYDSEQNPVPAEVAARLNNSVAAEPKRKSWFRNLFGR
jgi:hypothetical protein